jgi:hypothetical protein
MASLKAQCFSNSRVASVRRAPAPERAQLQVYLLFGSSCRSEGVRGQVDSGNDPDRAALVCRCAEQESRSFVTALSL